MPFSGCALPSAPPTAFDPLTATQKFTIGVADNVDFALAILVPRLIRLRRAPHSA